MAPAVAKRMRLGPYSLGAQGHVVASATPDTHYAFPPNLATLEPFASCLKVPGSSVGASPHRLECSDIELFLHFNEPLLAGEVFSVEAAVGVGVYVGPGSSPNWWHPGSSAALIQFLTQDWDPAAITWNNKPSGVDAALDTTVEGDGDSLNGVLQASTYLRWGREKFLSGGPWYGMKVSVPTSFEDNGDYFVEPFADLSAPDILVTY